MQLLCVVFGLSYARTQLSSATLSGHFLPAGNASRAADAAAPAPEHGQVEQGFLSRGHLEPHRVPDGSGIEDVAAAAAAGKPGGGPRISPLTVGRASRGSAAVSPRYGSESRFPLAREVTAGLALASGLIAIGLSWARPQREVEIADEPFAGMLCAIQAAASCAALGVLAQAMFASAPGLRGVLILTDGLAQGALIVRGVLAVVEAKHTVAAQQYRRRLVAWSAWLDVRSQLSFVIAVVAWLTASIVLVLFVMVSMGGRTLFPWAWWANHAVLSVAVLCLGCAQGPDRHPSQPPLAALVANVAAGVAHAAPAAGAPVPDLGIVACAVLQLCEALRGFRLARLDAASTEKASDRGAGPWRSALDRQLHATLVGNEDTGEFEQYLGRERRACVFYAFQDLLGCESAASHAEMKEKFAAWRSLFAGGRAPLRVAGLPEALEDAGAPDVCPQATVHKTKQALIGILREPYARYLSEKRRTLSAGSGFNHGSKSREHFSLLTAMRVPACLAKANANDETSTIV